MMSNMKICKTKQMFPCIATTIMVEVTIHELKISKRGF